MDIAIFGAGVAGLAAAAALAGDGHRCCVFEKRPHAAGGGMAFILTPSALPALAALGVRPEGGVQLQDFLHRDTAGRLRARQPLPEGARCVLRQQLLRDLGAALRGRVVVEEGAGLRGFRFDMAGRVRCAELDDGRALRANLYLAADGSRSAGRAALYPGWPQAPARVHEVVGLVDDADAADWAGAHFNKFNAPEEGLAFGLLPAQGRTLVWYLQYDSRRHAPAPAARTGGAAGEAALAAFVGQCVGHWGAPLPPLLRRIQYARAHLWRPLQCEPVPRFHRENLVLLGDAAHPLLPFASQGTAAALLDAVSLRDHLRASAAAGARGAAGSAPLALERYSAERHAARAVLAERGLALQAQFLDPQAAPALPVAACTTRHP